MLQLKLSDKIEKNIASVFLIDQEKSIKNYIKDNSLVKFVEESWKKEQKIFTLISDQQYIFVVKCPDDSKNQIKEEKIRQLGHTICQEINKLAIKEIQVESNIADNYLLSFVEGITLSNYRFAKYKTGKVANILSKIIVVDKKIKKSEIQELSNLCQSVYLCRNLVNEPVIYLSATQLAQDIKMMGKEAGFEVEILNHSKIKSLKMGGLLAVNAGSVDEPTFSILEYKPANALNKKPIILVGKGVVYDTGGLSLKPADSMEDMKCDMAGAATVAAAMYAAAANKIPAYIIGLIPSTDNRPSGNAIAPGDVITMHNGKTVEILNTDAEGRLILADALSFAKKYNPMLVIDLATLTGSAARAIGKEGIVYMGTAPDDIKHQFEKVAHSVHERLVEFPLWDEYGKQLESEIADYKNIGGPEAGAITAGKFLEVFTNYPWLHLDIAGVAFIKSEDSYRGKNGTGVGVRLLYQFIKQLVASKTMFEKL